MDASDTLQKYGNEESADDRCVNEATGEWSARTGSRLVVVFLSVFCGSIL